MNFDVEKYDCPWYVVDDGCTGNTYYNRNVNDPRYGKCHIELCPMIYWLRILIEDKNL